MKSNEQSTDEQEQKPSGLKEALSPGGPESDVNCLAEPEFPYKFKKGMMPEVAQIMQTGMASCRTIRGILDSLEPLATEDEKRIWLVGTGSCLKDLEDFFSVRYAMAAKIGYTDDSR